MMELVPIIQRDGRPGVSARALYRFLELNPAHYARWANSNIAENPFAARGDDWEVFTMNGENSEGRPSQDYALSLPLAKKLAMMSKSARAEQVRDYFLECERRALAATPAPPALDFSDPLTAARLFIEAESGRRAAEEARQAAERQLVLQAPSVAFARKVELSAVDVSVGAFAKIIGWGPNKLHEELRRRGFMYLQGGRPLPKQFYVVRGLFTVKEIIVNNRVCPVTAITGKGQLRLSQELGISCQQTLALAPY